jgi:hypothetical protein
VKTQRSVPAARVQHHIGQYYSFTYPVGWHVVVDELPVHNSYFRTQIVNPSQTQSVIIDRTPNEPLTPGQKSVQVQQFTEHTPNYVPLDSRPTTIAGREAFIWEFQLPEPGLGSYHVDVFLNRGTSGYAVLGSASSVSAILPITMSIAQSLTAR